MKFKCSEINTGTFSYAPFSMICMLQYSVQSYVEMVDFPLSSPFIFLTGDIVCLAFKVSMFYSSY